MKASPKASAVPASASKRATRRDGSSRAMRPPQAAWITDPQALLTALADAERAEREAREQARREVEMRHAPAPVEPAKPEPLPVADALPSLRDDERITRPADRNVIVIVRRRRAA